MAFILVSPSRSQPFQHPSDLLKRFTTMPVLQAEDGVCVEPNHLYIIPPNRDMAIFHRTLQLTTPVKTFRESECPSTSSCALSRRSGGNGDLRHSFRDGNRWLHGVRPSMRQADDHGPGGGNSQIRRDARSAIDTKLADSVLPASKMPEQLIAYVKSFP